MRLSLVSIAVAFVSLKAHATSLLFFRYRRRVHQGAPALFKPLRVFKAGSRASVSLGGSLKRRSLPRFSLKCSFATAGVTAPASARRSRVARSVICAQVFHKRQAALALRSFTCSLRSFGFNNCKVLVRASAWLATPSRVAPRLDLQLSRPTRHPQSRGAFGTISLLPRHQGLSASLRLASPSASAALGDFPPSYLRRSVRRIFQKSLKLLQRF